MHNDDSGFDVTPEDVRFNAIVLDCIRVQARTVLPDALMQSAKFELLPVFEDIGRASATQRRKVSVKFPATW